MAWRAARCVIVMAKGDRRTCSGTRAPYDERTIAAPGIARDRDFCRAGCAFYDIYDFARERAFPGIALPIRDGGRMRNNGEPMSLQAGATGYLASIVDRYIAPIPVEIGKRRVGMIGRAFGR